jgi:hypothetical protein
VTARVVEAAVPFPLLPAVKLPNPAAILAHPLTVAVSLMSDKNAIQSVFWISWLKKGCMRSLLFGSSPGNPEVRLFPGLRTESLQNRVIGSNSLRQRSDGGDRDQIASVSGSDVFETAAGGETTDGEAWLAS